MGAAEVIITAEAQKNNQLELADLYTKSKSRIKCLIENKHRGSHDFTVSIGRRFKATIRVCLTHRVFVEDAHVVNRDGVCMQDLSSMLLKRLVNSSMGQLTEYIEQFNFLQGISFSSDSVGLTIVQSIA